MKENEIDFEKYLTKAEIERIETEKERERKRIEALNADDMHLRALKMMMNNTLEDKKDNLEDEKDNQDWMNKPREEMNEEERAKYDEFSKKQELIIEETERMRKILTQELKKIKSENKEIISEFDTELRIFCMKRHEYKYRILEQEFFATKLKQTIHSEAQMEITIEQLCNDISKLNNESGNLCNMKDTLSDAIEWQTHVKTEIDGENQKLETKLMKQIMQSIYAFKDELKKKARNDNMNLLSLLEKLDFGSLNILDPYYKFSIEKLFDLIEYEPELYKKDIIELLQRKLDPDEVHQEYQRFCRLLSHKQKCKEFATLIQSLNESSVYLSNQLEVNQSKLNGLKQSQFELAEMLEKSEKSCYLMLRLKSETIELRTNKIIPIAEDIILIDRNEVIKLNQDIINLGSNKLALLKKSLEEKQKVENDLAELTIIEKEIKEAMVETAVLTRLKVGKKLQNALSKKDDKIMEVEEKNVKKQIEKLISVTETNLKTLKKKEMGMAKEIITLTQENENLLTKGVQLQESVNQRQEIFSMIYQQNPATGVNEENETNNQKTGDYKKDDAAYKRTMEIAKNRKMFDLAKKLAHEIETLMVELKRLKERTYPNIG